MTVNTSELRSGETKPTDEVKRVFLETFGCQMNKLDSELAMQQLSAEGFELTEQMNDADLIVFNTCSVRDHAEQKVRSRLGLLKYPKYRKQNAVVAVMGCMAQREGQDLLDRTPAVDLVVGTKTFMELPQLYRDAREARQRKVADEIAHEFRYTRDISYRSEGHRAFVSIMRGCDLKCTYCIVPETRGREQSRPLAEIVDEVERLTDDGVREVTLLGQTVNSWGKQLSPKQTLADLLEALEEVDGLARVRFITSHPIFFFKGFWERIAPLKKVCRYFHVPAQHGSNRMLDAMKRLYTREQYLDMAREAKAVMPDVALAGDIIVGFPGETEEDYAQCETLLREVGFQNNFIFKYSPRPGTPSAESMIDDVPKAVKDRRCHELIKIQEELSLARNEAAIGREVEVLVDGPSKKNDTVLSGRSDDNRIVIFEGPRRLTGELVKVKLERCSPNTLYGTLIEAPESRTRPWRPRPLPIIS